MAKKGVFDAGAVWLEALLEFEDELHEHVEQTGADMLRFQTGRLFALLVRRIKAKATGKDEWVLLFACYEFATKTSHRFGYGEARRLHGEEMKWLEKSSAAEFCRVLPKRFGKDPDRMLEELLQRVRSIAAWMECQESFSVWLVFKGFHRGWRLKGEDRARAVAALYLSRQSFRARVLEGYGGKPWTRGQWCNILEQAKSLLKKRFLCTELERWVWWCYPVFARYEWNAREVLEAASRRGVDFGQEKKGIDQLITFQKYWIRSGLRFSGGKQSLDRVPALKGFVESMVLPDPRTMWGEVGGLLFLPKKN